LRAYSWIDLTSKIALGLFAKVFCWYKHFRQAYNLIVKTLTLPIVIEGDSDGYVVSCPALQGCYSQGKTYEEAVENIKDAIRLHIEDRLADGEKFPENVSVSLSTVEVAV
jgi:predicted RNase H-like HicB family nuclease